MTLEQKKRVFYFVSSQLRRFIRFVFESRIISCTLSTKVGEVWDKLRRIKKAAF